ncbi:MAG: hypothetical protein NVS9B8_11390 [Candidatus Limnocylindrales bacterium]
MAALAVVGCLAMPYVHDLTRTARLDVPAAALALGYVVIGIDAVRRGSPWRGLLAGLIFAIAFLVKEIAVPFARVPFGVGILIGRPIASICRVAAAALLVALVGTAWWFAMYADFTHAVYRLGTPAWTMGPLLALAVIAVGLGLAAPRIARPPEIATASRRLLARLPAGGRDRLRAIAAWALAFAWFAALVVFFDRNPEIKGLGLFRPSQYILYLQTWLPQLIVVAAFGSIGILLSLIARRSAGPAAREGIDTLLIATICTIPLVMLVITVGEPPRNYLAQIGVLTALSASGWLWALEWALTGPPSARTVAAFAGVGLVVGAIVAEALPAVPLALGLPVGAVAGLLVGLVPIGRRTATVGGQANRLSDRSLAVALAAAFLVASTVLSAHALRYGESPSGRARAAAVSAASSWIAANRPPGTKIGFGSFLGYETALDVASGYPMVQIHQSLAVVDPKASLGLRVGSGLPASDWIAVEISRREREFYVFSGAAFAKAIKASGISVYVYDTGPTTSVPALLGALTPAHGFSELASWSFPVISSDGQTSTTETHIFAVDQARVGFDQSPMYISAGALDRFVGLLTRSPVASPATAAALAGRLSAWPQPSAGAVTIARLRAIVGP